MRRAHWLRGNRAVQLPQMAVWLDTESYQSETRPGEIRHHLRMGWACYQRRKGRQTWTEPRWQRFETPDDLWAWVGSLCRPRTRLYVFAHNWSFDAPILGAFEILPRLGWTLTKAIIESPPTAIAWRRLNQSVELLDTLNWFQTPLRDLGERLGIPKLPMPEPGASADEWDAYCRRDVEVIRRAMLEWWGFVDAHQLGGFARTLAGQAMRAYRHRFMPCPILIDDDERALAVARHAMHGGRVECYRPGRVEGPITVLDVNSMYPAVMAAHRYPAILRLYSRSATVRELRRWVRRYCAVADVRLETESPQYAIRLDGRTVFPVGRFRAYLTTPDIQAAIAQGHLRGVEQVALYDPADLFGPYVCELYQLRREAIRAGRVTEAWHLKLLLNALYGKWGQRGSVWSKIAATDDVGVRSWRELDGETGVLRELRQFAGIVQERLADTEPHDSSPAIAAHVSAFARRALWQLIERAGRTNVMYVDTDALHVNAQGAELLQDLTHPTLLGRLKLVEILDWVQYHAQKDYRTPARVVCKGVKAQATWVTESIVRQQEWLSLTGLLDRGDLSAPITTLRTVHLHRRATSRGDTGREAYSPLRLQEW